MIYFTSDTHYSHKNICRGVSGWQEQSTRNFATVEQMNQAIVDGINSTVGIDDELWHLGDWSFGGINQIWEFRKRINCKDIHLIFGNHDEHIEANRKLPNAVLTQADKDFWDSDIVTAKRLFSSTQYVKILRTGKQTLFLSHYAHRVWDKSHHGRIHLYGHSHNSLEQQEWGKSMDVGIDATFARFGIYRPFSLTEILEIMDKRKVEIVDHHNSKTN